MLWTVNDDTGRTVVSFVYKDDGDDAAIGFLVGEECEGRLI
jgi:hypothetical protein